MELDNTVPREWIKSKEDLSKFLETANISKSSTILKSLFFEDVNKKNSLERNALFFTDLEMTKYLLSKNKIDVNCKDFYGNNALFFSNKDKLNILVNAGSNIHEVNFKGENLLFFCNSIEKIKYLLECGVNKEQKDNAGKTPLFTVNDKEILSLMIEYGCDINATDYLERNALAYASPLMLKSFIDSGIDLSIYPFDKKELKLIFKDDEKVDYVYEAKIKKIENEKEIISEAMNNVSSEKKINYKTRL